MKFELCQFVLSGPLGHMALSLFPDCIGVTNRNRFPRGILVHSSPVFSNKHIKFTVFMNIPAVYLFARIITEEITKQPVRIHYFYLSEYVPKDS